MTMSDGTLIDHRVRSAADELTEGTVLSISPATSGANSRIYRVDTSQGTFALKSYPIRLNETRSRADVEWQTLRFLSTRGVASVPVPLARDAAGQFMLMEWIEGSAIRQHTAAELAEAAQFIVQIFDLSADPGAAEFPPASEACLSTKSIVNQIEERLPFLASDAMLQPFLSGTFLPLLSAAKQSVASELRHPVELAASLRRLIPADFGFHNTVRQADRSRYVDFEYFGWDDPVKLTADFLVHPAMNLSADDNRNFLRPIRAALAADGDFSARLLRQLPLFALRWILILFNPFRLDRVGEYSQDESARRTLLQERLDKAERLLLWTDPQSVASKIALR